jgi:hypothetical protein
VTRPGRPEREHRSASRLDRARGGTIARAWMRVPPRYNRSVCGAPGRVIVHSSADIART